MARRSEDTIDFIEKHCFDETGHMYLLGDSRGQAPAQAPLCVLGDIRLDSDVGVCTGHRRPAVGHERALQVFEDTQRFLTTPGFLPAKFEPNVQMQSHSIIMILINVGSCIRKVIDDPKLTAQIDESIEKLKKYFIHPEFKCLLETVGMNGEFVDTR